MPIRFDNSYARDLAGFYVAQRPELPHGPHVLRYNAALAAELGVPPEVEASAAQVFSGAEVPQGATPIAQAYAGHQFGGFSPMLGDGRAVLLGEVIDTNGQRRDIALKGSGRTPFSRGGDGKAAIGPVLREYLIGEAMYALGVPTTRALAAVATGTQVWRETALPGAVLTRVAASHLRIGTFEFFSARGEADKLRQLADYAIARHDPDLPTGEDRYLMWFDRVVARQCRLVAQWMGLGFIHGVMNTDNMTISGETIDYGPCAFMELYAPGTVFSSIDRGGRYAYANQPQILGWNLARLAEAVLALLGPDEDRAVANANDILGGIAARFQAEWLAVMRAKLGLSAEDSSDDLGDMALAQDLLRAMEGQGADWTLTFRRLSADDEGRLRPVFADFTAMQAWLPRWRARRAADFAQRMDLANPIYIPRNQQVDAALRAAEGGDLAPFEALLAVITAPFVEKPGLEAYALPAPATFSAGFRTFCGT